MKILLTNPRDNLTLDNDIFPRLSLLNLGTLARQRGHQVKIIHQRADDVLTEQQISKEVFSYNPDIVGITMTTFQTKWARIISEEVKKLSKDILVVIGGPHPSALGSQILDGFKSVDVACLGEGEETWKDILEGRDLSLIDGTINRIEENILITPPRPLLDNLDTIPFPDLSLVDLKRFSGPYPMKRLPCMSLMASRGCPYNCSFCCKATYGHKVRHHSPEYILGYIEYLVTWGVKEVYFEDDSININRGWIDSILEGILRKGLNKKVTFRGGMRANRELVDSVLLTDMKKAGFWSLFYGVESGNQSMLDRMGKKLTLEEVRRAFELTHKVGIRTESPFIIGLPGETEETIKDSIKLSKELKAYMIGFARAIPFPGTPFNEEIKKKGQLLNEDYDTWSYLTTLIRTDSLIPEDIEKWERYGNKLVLINLAKRCLQDPRLLLTTMRAVGIKEVLSKIARNLK